MKRTVLYLLFALLLINCGSQPQTLSELKSEYVTIDDSVRVHYKLWNESAGSDAKTICFVHGFGCDMNTWEKQFETFRYTKDLQLVFIDLPGYGQSDKPHVDYTLDFFAHAIDEVLNKNSIKDAVFVCHSLGTPVCRQTLMTTDHKGALVDVDGAYCFYDGTETPEYVEAVIDRFHNPIRDTFHIKKMALLLVGAATLPELFDAILAEYNLCLKFFSIEDAGKVLVRGVKDKGDILGTSFLEDAYQLGTSI